MPKFTRSLVKASSFNLACSTFEKIGTPLSSSTSSLRFIASSSMRLRRRHQLGIEPAFCRQVRRRSLGDHAATLRNDDLIERLRLVGTVGDPEHAFFLFRRTGQDVVADAVLRAP